MRTTEQLLAIQSQPLPRDVYQGESGYPLVFSGMTGGGLFCGDWIKVIGDDPINPRRVIVESYWENERYCIYRESISTRAEHAESTKRCNAAISRLVADGLIRL